LPLKTYIGQVILAYVCQYLSLRITQFKEGDNNMKIYVGNLSYEVTEQDLRQEFGAFGGIASIDIITDKYSGRPKGFGFVEMTTKSEAEAAITGLNGKELKERTIVVNEARPRTDNRGGGSYGNRRGSGYGGGRGGGFGGGRQRSY
jgi:cold-inducible RNA-binding protein